MCFRQNTPFSTNSRAKQEKRGLAKRLGIVQETPVRHELIILADSPGALVEVCGISLLERHLRTVQRLDVTKVVVLSAMPDLIRSHLAGRSRQRAKVAIDLRPLAISSPIPLQIANALPNDAQVVVMRGDCLFDSRLLRLLDDQNAPAALVDSRPPPSLETLVSAAGWTKRGRLCGAALLSREWLQSSREAFDGALEQGINAGEIDALDIVGRDWHHVSMRRQLRPLWFPAPGPQQQKHAAKLLVQSAQKGCLDFPAIVHGPIENFLISYLCRTSITPNQLTLITNIVAWAATFCFALGHLIWGTILALAVGVLDGLDGKQARIKVETSKIGKLEHTFDAVFEHSWWIAIAYYLQTSGRLSSAVVYLLLLMGAEGFAALIKLSVIRSCGRTLEDLGEFNRLVRLIGGRRNVYIWIFSLGLVLGKPVQAYQMMAIWAVATAIVQLPAALLAVRARRERILPPELTVEA
jgi:phosphatidylglycerophosphate synthase